MFRYERIAIRRLIHVLEDPGFKKWNLQQKPEQFEGNSKGQQNSENKRNNFYVDH